MKYIKVSFTVFLFFLFISVGNAQSPKMVAKAAEKAEEINRMIISVNPDLALDAKQTKQIQDLMIEKTKGIRAVKKSNATEEEITAKVKAINKEFNQKLHKEVLTKEQRLAKKTAKSKKTK